MDFHFCSKICNKTNSRTLISNMTRSFSNYIPKIPKSGRFSPKLKDFYFCTELFNKTSSRTQIPNMTKVFSNFSPKIGYEKQNFWSQLLAFCFFHEILQVDKFGVLVSNIRNIVFEFQPKNI